MSRTYIPDNYDIWESHENRRNKELEQLPRCDCCDNPITDDYCYEINGDCICEDCMNSQFRKAVEV